MNKVIELTYELKKELDELPLFQEYRRIKSLADNSIELKELKQEIVKSSSNKEENKRLIEKYNSHPLVVNYLSIRDEVVALLTQIKDILSD